MIIANYKNSKSGEYLKLIKNNNMEYKVIDYLNKNVVKLRLKNLFIN